MAAARDHDGEQHVRQPSPSAAPAASGAAVAAPALHARLLGLQRTAGNAAVARVVGDRASAALLPRPSRPVPRAADPDAGSAGSRLLQRAVAARRAAAADPVSVTTYAEDPPPEDQLDIVSASTAPESQSGTAPPAPPTPGTPPTPATPPAPPATPACVLTTSTVVPAPDGTADTRTTVGVNEEVVMTAPSSGTWTTTGGTLSATTGTTVTWTAPVAPPAGRSFTVRSTPSAGPVCSLAMRVVPPARRQLTVRSSTVVPPGLRTYTAGRAGSGFVADVQIHPLNVSFSRLQVREGRVRATATGYYKDVLGWNGKVHQLGTWLTLDAANGGIIDTVGTTPPGSGGTFKAGRFRWPIPQFYRRVGSTTNGLRYSVGTHEQVMTGNTGAETTSKEGATRTRSP